MNKKSVFFLVFIFSLFSSVYSMDDEYRDFCTIYSYSKSSNKPIYTETHEKVPESFCRYYLDQCNEEYQQKLRRKGRKAKANLCSMKMNSYQPLYNTNNTLATIHVAYRDNLDRGSI